MLTFKDSFVVCVILNKVKNLKIYRYFATLSMTCAPGQQLYCYLN